MQIQMLEIGRIRPNPKNLRKHSSKQIGQIATSMSKLGIFNALLVTEDYEILAGHGRYEAAMKLGIRELPVIVLAGLSPAKRRAIAIIDNRSAENSTWDTIALAAELPKLEKLMIAEGLKPSLLGFKPPTIKPLKAAEAKEIRACDAKTFEITDGTILVAKPGDQFMLAGHTILCSDPCASGAMKRLMNNRRADFVYIDSPVESLAHSNKSISPDGSIHRVLSDAASVSRTGAVNVFTTNSDAQQMADKVLVGLINAATRRGDLILGISQKPSSMITVADHTGRLACVIAKAPNEVDVAIRRWQAITGLKATRADNGLLFDALAQRRSDDDRQTMTGESIHGAR